MMRYLLTSFRGTALHLRQLAFALARVPAGLADHEAVRHSGRVQQMWQNLDLEDDQP
jgi:hypothetical protein